MSEVTTKRLEARYLDHLAAAVRGILEGFPNERAAAAAIGISQAHLSQIKRGSETGLRGPGLAVLIRLRAFTGRTIDDLLGLEPVQRRPGLARARDRGADAERARHHR